MKTIHPSIIDSIQSTVFPSDQLRNKTRTQAAARLSSTLNRQQASVPFDDNRVKLKNVLKSDYINCSRINTNIPEIQNVLVGEVPLEENNEDMWRVIWDEQVHSKL